MSSTTCSTLVSGRSAGLTVSSEIIEAPSCSSRYCPASKCACDQPWSFSGPTRTIPKVSSPPAEAVVSVAGVVSGGAVVSAPLVSVITVVCTSPVVAEVVVCGGPRSAGVVSVRALRAGRCDQSQQHGE